jgi:hypothetical protein
LDAEEARREFIKFRAKQFDPSICDVVVSPDVWAELFESVQETRSAAQSEAPAVKSAVA